jgi:LysM repeat protein
LPIFIAWAKAQVASPVPASAITDLPTVEPTAQTSESDSEFGAPPLAPAAAQLNGISRRLLFDTVIPTRPRVDVITYTVEAGDSLFSIADQYNLKPETILWGNFETLEDNPHLLSTGQVLNILPTNGTYYRWSAGDNLDGIAQFFGVDTKAIKEYPGNPIDLTAVSPAIPSPRHLVTPRRKPPAERLGTSSNQPLQPGFSSILWRWLLWFDLRRGSRYGWLCLANNRPLDLWVRLFWHPPGD